MSKSSKRERERARRQRRAPRKIDQRAAAGAGARNGAPISSAAEPIRGTTAETIDPALCWHLARVGARLGSLGRKTLGEALKVTQHDRRVKARSRLGMDRAGVAETGRHLAKILATWAISNAQRREQTDRACPRHHSVASSGEASALGSRALVPQRYAQNYTLTAKFESAFPRIITR